MKIEMEPLAVDARSLEDALDAFDDLGLDSAFFGELLNESLNSSKDDANRRHHSAKKPKRVSPKTEILRLPSEIESLQAIVQQVAGSGCAQEREAERRGRNELLRYKIENEKLRKMVASCIKESRRFVKMSTRTLRDCAHLGIDRMASTATAYVGPRVPPPAQLQRLDLLQVLYGAPDRPALFDLDGHKELLEIAFRCLDGDSSSDAIEIEVKMAWQVPFPIDQVSCSVWRQAAQMSSKEVVYKCEDTHTEPNLIVARVIAGPRDLMSGSSALSRQRLGFRLGMVEVASSRPHYKGTSSLGMSASRQ